MLNLRIQKLQYLTGGNRLGQTHDVFIFNDLLGPAFSLDLFRSLKFYQAMLYQDIRQAVPGYGNHSVRGYGTFFGNGNIAGSRADIHQCHI